MNFKFIPLEERIVLDAAAAAEVLSSYAMEGLANYADISADSALSADHQDGSSFEGNSQNEQSYQLDQPNDQLTPSQELADQLQMSSHTESVFQQMDTSAINLLSEFNQADRLLVISADVEDANLLANAALGPVVLYDPSNTSLDQLYARMQDALDGELASSIAFVSHGQRGEFSLTDAMNVSAESLQNAEMHDFWNKIGDLMNDGGRIDLLACNVADNGSELLQQLDNIIDGKHDISVAASMNETSNTTDWILETSNIDAAAVYFNQKLLSEWNGSLSSPDDNEAPVGQDDGPFYGLFALNSTLQIPQEILLANDYDPDGDPLTLILQSSNSQQGGSVSYANGVITYTFLGGFSNIDYFYYYVSDGQTQTESANIVQIFLPFITTNNVPWAFNDEVSMNEGQTYNFGNLSSLLSNDHDVDSSNTLSVTSHTDPSHGTLSLDSGNWIYTPNTNYSGQDQFTYTISDGHGGIDTAIVTINIADVIPDNPANEAPIAEGDGPFFVMGGTLNTIQIHQDILLANDYDPDGDPLFITLGPTGEGLVSISNGVITYTSQGGIIADTFSYYVNDGQTQSEFSASVLILFTGGPPNNAPWAFNDAVSVNGGQSYNFGNLSSLLSNDHDVDPSNTLSVASHTDPSHGTLLQVSGNWIYTPYANHIGQDQFTYTISDGNGKTDTAIVTINILNNAPVAGDDQINILEDQTHNFGDFSSLLGTDSDADGHTLSVISHTNPGHGTLLQNNNGDWIYTPVANYFGQDQFTYTISDGHGGEDTATVTINIASVNDLPVAEDVNVNTNEDTGFSLSLSDHALDFDIFAHVTNGFYYLEDGLGGTNFLTTAHGGQIVLNQFTGSVNYTPAANYNGPDSFQYYFTDISTSETSNTATVTINIASINDNPVAGDDQINILEDQTHNFGDFSSLFGNDNDPDGNTISVISHTNPGHGTLLQNNNGDWIYTPAPNHFGNDQFTYKISDGNGGEDTATVTINIASVNDLPVAENVNVNTNEDTGFSLSLSDHALDFDIFAHVTNGFYYLEDGLGGTNFLTTAHGGQIVLNQFTGSVNYTPAANYYGPDSFQYYFTDLSTSETSNTATVTINIASINDNPVAGDDGPFSVNQGGWISIFEDTLLNNDSDPDGDSLTANLITLITPNNGTVTFINGIFTYTPDPSFSGIDSFLYEVNDGFQFSEATVTINVINTNEAPVALDDSYTIHHDTGTPANLNADVTDNDSDPDGDNLIVSLLSGPSHGNLVLNPDGSFSYSANAGYSGTDSFTYSISDGQESDQATATIRINNKPTLDLSGADRIYTENAPTSTIISPSISISDTDHSSYNGSQLSFQVTNGALGDRLIIVETPNTIDTDNGSIFFKGVLIGTYSGGTESNPLIITFNVNATQIMVKDIAKHVGFYNTTESPSIVDRNVAVQFTDQYGGQSDVQSKTIHVYSINDSPEIYLADSNIDVSKNTWTNIGALLGIDISDIDAPAGVPLSVTLRVNVGTLNITDLQALNGITFLINPGANGLKEITFEGTLAEINEALDHVMYKSKLNFTGTDKLYIHVEDGGTDYFGQEVDARQTQGGNVKFDNEMATILVS